MMIAFAQDDPQHSETALEAVTEVEKHIDDGHSGPVTSDTNFWVLLAFLIVVGIFLWQGVPKMIGSFLSARAEGVQRQLDEARTLREEAQRTLADFQKRQREAETEAEAIIEQAKADAKSVATEARAKLDEQIARRRKAAEDRIARAETQAIAEIRGRTADMAIAAAREIIANRMDDRSQGQLIDRAINEVGTRLN